MPRLRKTDAQRRADRFSEHYRVGKARLQLRDADIATVLHVAPSTMQRYKNDPAKLSLEQIVLIGSIFGWTACEYMDIISGGKGD